MHLESVDSARCKDLAVGFCLSAGRLLGEDGTRYDIRHTKACRAVGSKSNINDATDQPPTLSLLWMETLWVSTYWV